jgi:6,7-dimethyl-8-ribityllumazine synthase
MVRNENRAASTPELSLASGPDYRVLILEAPYYADVTRELIEGAIVVLENAGVAYDRIAVGGALELPQALIQAVQAGLIADLASKTRYAGVIVLGCVIRGETAHYDIVCNNTNHWLMETAVRNAIPLGNGVLTVDNHSQALARAQGGASGKGGDAARACLQLIWLATQFEEQRLLLS